MDEWDRERGGRLVVQPVLGWALALMPTAGVLRLECRASIGGSVQSGAAQLGLSVGQMRELAESLLKLADAIQHDAGSARH